MSTHRLSTHSRKICRVWVPRELGRAGGNYPRHGVRRSFVSLVLDSRDEFRMTIRSLIEPASDRYPTVSRDRSRVVVKIDYIIDIFVISVGR